MIEEKIKDILKNEFVFPEISEAQILGLSSEDEETLILVMPITNRRGKIKFLRIKPPTFTQHDAFCRELASYQITALAKAGIIRDDEKAVNKQIELKEILGMLLTDTKAGFDILEKYLIIKKKSCSMRWLKKNINLLQLQKILAYMVLLPEAVKKNDLFLAQKLGITRHLQTLTGHLDRSADGSRELLRPRY